ncbi:hypothetical protein M413DRAFT_422785, partial [Hebeloma cylindrosporum]
SQFVNADGFGVTWYTDARSQFNPLKDESNPGEQAVGHNRMRNIYGPHPAMYKTTIAQPLYDPSFLSLCANISSKCIFAHLRGAGGPPIATTNNHPFVFGRHCFMHNGWISDFREIRKEMLSHISEGFTAMIEGGTDSEHLAAIYMSYLCEPADFHGADKSYPASSMWKALKSAIQTVEDIQRKRGKTAENFLNICATDGESLLALCYRTKNSPSTPPFDLWLSVDVADTLNRKPYAYSNAAGSEGTLSEDDVAKSTDDDLQRNTKRAIQRDHDNKVIGQLFLILRYSALNGNSFTGLDTQLGRLLAEGERPFPSRHGPHVVVASEPTSKLFRSLVCCQGALTFVAVHPGWFNFCNRDAILVETVCRGDVRVVNLSPETF